MHGDGEILRALRLAILVFSWAASIEARVLNTGGVPNELQMKTHSRELQQAVEEKIVGGSDVACGRFPYMASLRSSEGIHRCGGVLIDAQWVLTAAHCVDENSVLASNMVIAVGACNQNDERGLENYGRTVEVFRIQDIIIHEGWTGKSEDGYDIALLQLRGESVNPPVPIAVRSNVLDGVQRVSALGWGLAEDGEPAQDLQYTGKLTVLQNKYCNDEEDGWDGIIQETMVCAFGLGDGGDTCPGDSGGPLLMLFDDGETGNGSPDLDTLVGITSFGEDRDCGTSNLPGVYTRVSSFSEWIKATTEGRGNATVNPTSANVAAVPEVPSPNSPDESEVPSTTPAGTSSESINAMPLTPAQEFTAALDPAVTRENGCTCSENGVSGDMETGLRGCSRRMPAGIPLCYLASGEDCDIGVESVLFPGAVWMPCEDDEGIQQLPTAKELAEEEQTMLNRELADIASKAETTGQEIRELLESGANPEFRWKGDIPVLQLVAGRGSVAVASALIEAGANVDATDDFGSTALHVAASFARFDLVQLLVGVGADVTVRDASQQTAQDATCWVMSCPADERRDMQLLLSPE